MRSHRTKEWILATFLSLFAATQTHAFYNANTGRWLSRDPIDETGGANLYAFVSNASIAKFDPDGRESIDSSCNCCDDRRILEGVNILFQRWRRAVAFLDSHGAQIDPDDVTGISCIESANRILAFMSPAPPCWTCYIQRRSWSWNPFGSDENSILCKPNRKRWDGIVFDWWYQKYIGAKNYTIYPAVTYESMFGWDLDPPLGGWWDKKNPAPHDTCSTKSTWSSQDYKWLWPVVPK